MTKETELLKELVAAVRPVVPRSNELNRAYHAAKDYLLKIDQGNWENISWANHTDLLNFIAKKINAKTYLEIGVQNPDSNFNKIEVADKLSIDPDPKAEADVPWTSDKFFELFLATDKNGKRGQIRIIAREKEGRVGKCPSAFDLIFIDGLHHADQVRKDIENAWKCLNPGGVIVVHDCDPPSENITHVPRKTKIWTGDVYRTICQIVSPGFFTVDFDYGCCVIRKGNDELEIDDQKISWELFDKNRTVLLNLISVDEAIKKIDSWI